MSAPSIEAARAMGAEGSQASEAERLAFEAWMHGHCWALCAAWDGEGYRSDAEQDGTVSMQAMVTRRLWAAWRDRAALAKPLAEALREARDARDAASSKCIGLQFELGKAEAEIKQLRAYIAAPWE